MYICIYSPLLSVGVWLLYVVCFLLYVVCCMLFFACLHSLFKSLHFIILPPLSGWLFSPYLQYNGLMVAVEVGYYIFYHILTTEKIRIHFRPPPPILGLLWRPNIFIYMCIFFFSFIFCYIYIYIYAHTYIRTAHMVLHCLTFHIEAVASFQMHTF